MSKGSNYLTGAEALVKLLEKHEVKYDQWPGPKSLHGWKQHFYRKTRNASGRPVSCMKYLLEIDKAKSMQEFANHGKFTNLSGKIAEGFLLGDHHR